MEDKKYYCKDCKIVVDSTTCDKCGKQLDRKDEIIYCPTCNKMYFKPAKSFTCRQCNSYVQVEPDAPQQRAGGTTNQTFASMFMNQSAGNNAAGNNYNSQSSVGGDNGQNGTRYQDNYNGQSGVQNQGGYNGQNSFQSQGSFSNAYGNNQSQQSTEPRFQHSQFGSGSAQNGQSTSNDSAEFDFSQFEDVDSKSYEKESKKNKKSRSGGNGGGSVSKSTLVLSAILFVIAAVAIVYFVVLPLTTPSDRLSWNSYINSVNEYNKAVGDSTKYTTSKYESSKDGGVIVAKIVIDITTYNEETNTENVDSKTLTVTFVEKNGKYVLPADFSLEDELAGE